MSGKNKEPNLSVGPPQRKPIDENRVGPVGVTVDEFIDHVAQGNSPLASMVVSLPMRVEDRPAVGMFMLAPGERPLAQMFVDAPEDLAELLDLFIAAGKRAFGERAMVKALIPVISKIATHTIVIPGGKLTDDGKTDPENLPN